MGGFATAVSFVEPAASAAISPAGVRIAIWILASIFALSGIAKLRQPVEVAIAMVNFGVVRKIRPWLGQGLGLAEVVISAALIVAPPLGVFVSTMLLWLFVFIIARSLVAGRQFPCSCFGAAAPLSRWTLVRTLLLALLASGAFLVTDRLSGLALAEDLLAMVTAGAILGIIAAGSQVP